MTIPESAFGARVLKVTISEPESGRFQYPGRQVRPPLPEAAAYRAGPRIIA